MVRLTMILNSLIYLETKMDKKARAEIENKFHRAEDLMNENPNQALSELDGIKPDVLPEGLRYYYYHLSGHIHYIRDDFDDAIICYNLALKNPDLNKEKIALIYKNLASIYNDKDMYDTSIEYANKALEFSKKHKIISSALQILASDFRNKNKLSESISYLLQTLDLYKEKRKDNWSKDMVEGSYASLCFDYWKLSDDEKSEFYFNKLTSLKDASDFQISRAYLCKAHRLYEKRQWKEALEHYNKATALMSDEEEKQHYQKYIGDCEEKLRHINPGSSY